MNFNDEAYLRMEDSQLQVTVEKVLKALPEENDEMILVVKVINELLPKKQNPTGFDLALDDPRRTTEYTNFVNSQGGFEVLSERIIRVINSIRNTNTGSRNQ